MGITPVAPNLATSDKCVPGWHSSLPALGCRYAPRRRGNTVLTHNYFSLDGDVKDVYMQTTFLALLGPAATSCTNVLYRPETLTSPYRPWKFRVRNIIFCNVSFTQTTITDFEFTNCTFQRCLFIGTIFRNCRFTSCHFVNCNPHRVEFEECFLDPRSFVNCIPERRYANIGVYLFQELLRNSRQQAQPDFSDEAQYHFRRWQRFQLRQELGESRPLRSKCGMGLRFIGYLVFDLTAGSGMRLGRLMISALCLLLFISASNWLFAGLFGLQQNARNIVSFIDAFYFSAVVMTTLGFGDITPTTWIGRLFVSGEAIIGFTLFALLASTMYRRFYS